MSHFSSRPLRNIECNQHSPLVISPVQKLDRIDQCGSTKNEHDPTPPLSSNCQHQQISSIHPIKSIAGQFFRLITKFKRERWFIICSTGTMSTNSFMTTPALPTARRTTTSQFNLRPWWKKSKSIQLTHSAACVPPTWLRCRNDGYCVVSVPTAI